VGFGVRGWINKFQRKFETHFVPHAELVNKMLTEYEQVKTNTTTYHALTVRKKEDLPSAMT
jgi:uncharacterized membrane-anchored protein YhcB (DUF1043 family)